MALYACYFTHLLTRPAHASPQPPLASRPDANGRGLQVGINYSRLAQLGPGGALQQAVTKVVTIGRRLGDGFADDGSDAPDVVLFDPAEFPGGWVLGAGRVKDRDAFGSPGASA